MIRIKRLPTPKALADPDSPGPHERARAERFYEIEENRLKKLPGGFKAYKHPDVKIALEESFHGKCAYCEGVYVAYHPVDIEHFRPKGGVIDRGVLRKPGYYWLAAEWDNLLPSCIDCNRARKHETIQTGPELSGKANLFPISNENSRARLPHQERNEKRLLLHPCRDRPSAHLAFQADGVVLATSTKGRESIKVYGLNRLDLIRARRKRYSRVIAQMSQTTYALKKLKDSNAIEDKSALASCLHNLFKFTDPTEPFLGLVEPLVKPYIELMAIKITGDLAEAFPRNYSTLQIVEGFVEQYRIDDVDPLGELLVS